MAWSWPWRVERFWLGRERAAKRQCARLDRRIRTIAGRIRGMVAEIEHARAKTTETFREFDRALFRLEMANGYDPTHLSSRRRSEPCTHEEDDHGASRRGWSRARHNRSG